MDALQSRPVKLQRGILAAWLLLALVAALYCTWRFVATSPLQTNLLALLPATEADPVADLAVERLASTLGDRTVYLVSSEDDAHAKAAATRFAAALAASHAFRSVTAQLPPFDLSQIGSVYLPYRFGLLTPADRAALAKGPAALHDALMQRLYAPPGGALTTPLADDPFGWLEHWLAGLPLATSNLSIEDSLLVAHQGSTTSVLVVATLPGSAYGSDTQRAVLAATSSAEAQMKRAFSDVTLARTGAVFYGEAARSSSERDVHRIGIVSLVGVALLMLWIFRSPRLLVLGFLSTALGILCALAATMLVFGKLHLLTLVFGASLIGEAVDYSIQYFVVYLAAGSAGRADTHIVTNTGASTSASTVSTPPRRWDAREGARAVMPALGVALATSLLGYAILAWVPFPALKQIACFAIVGISVAFASVLWLLPALLKGAPARSPQWLFAAAALLLVKWQRAIGGRRTWWLAALLLIVAAPGWLQLRSDDDIHLLIQRDPALVAQEQRIAHSVGVDNSAQFFVVRGDSADAVLQRAEALGAKLDALTHTDDTGHGAGDGPGDGPENSAAHITGWQSVTSFVPSAGRQQADRALLDAHVFNDPQAVRQLLVDAGFRDNVADAWLAAYAQSAHRTLTVERWLAAPWSQPFRHLWLGQVALATPVYAAVVIPQGVTAANGPALIALAATLPGVSFVDKAASVSKLFGAYRVDSGWWLAGALLLVLLLLMVRYGARGGIAVGLPVLLAVAVTLGAFGYARVPCNLFNWLALMLVLGVGANYAVFLREGAARDHADLGAVWTGVLLSAATTLLSFGMLGMSSMPALRSFGGTLAPGIAVAVLLAPIAIRQDIKEVRTA